MGKLGTITIGQAPRADITPILDAALRPDLPRCHVGLLDGLSRDEIEARFGRKQGRPVLVSLLRDGTSVMVDKEIAEASIQRKIDLLEEDGCTTILLLCTGHFAELRTRGAALVTPERILAPTLAALSAGRQVGMLVPLPEQIESEGAKWGVLSSPPICAATSPYTASDAELAEAAKKLRDAGAQLLMTDCMGFTERHRHIVSTASGLPVVLSNAVIAKLVAEIT
jgi:protein AroM